MTKKLISSTWVSDEGIKMIFTWYPGSDITQFKPFTQVYGVVFDKQSNILIQRRGSGDWCLAGGTVEKNETADQTLVREIIEEADVTIKNPILLGGQRVQFTGGHNPNPSNRGGDDFYQLRYYCEVDKILPQTPDPDHGIINERLFVPSEKINDYLKWGATGAAIFDQAINLYKTQQCK